MYSYVRICRRRLAFKSPHVDMPNGLTTHKSNCDLADHVADSISHDFADN